ncbi:hypothetical protein BDD12DRAFT_838107 [Trichophaea hybrida]|nr:hypothetical protein BDD12DRAFT_838107 [Trichophaea hybrida]
MTKPTSPPPPGEPARWRRSPAITLLPLKQKLHSELQSGWALADIYCEFLTQVFARPELEILLATLSQYSISGCPVLFSETSIKPMQFSLATSMLPLLRARGYTMDTTLRYPHETPGYSQPRGQYIYSVLWCVWSQTCMSDSGSGLAGQSACHGPCVWRKFIWLQIHDGSSLALALSNLHCALLNSLAFCSCFFLLFPCSMCTRCQCHDYPTLELH